MTARPDLVLSKVTVAAVIPVQDELTRFLGYQQTYKAVFEVDTHTWECRGEVVGQGGIVLADEVWWRDQCQRVSDRVRAWVDTGLDEVQVPS